MPQDSSTKWFWITAVLAVLVILVPLTVVWLILQVSPEIRIVATISIVVIWGIVSGYKDWVISKGKEAEKPPSEA